MCCSWFCLCSHPASQVDNVDEWGALALPAGYPFAEPDTEDNIVVDEDDNKLVLSATLEKLVERLTSEKYLNQTLVSAFLLTYPLMTSGQALLDLLIARYNLPYPIAEDSATRSKYEAKVVRPVRLRVFNALKQWMDKCPQVGRSWRVSV
jgi:hypothetical protein